MSKQKIKPLREPLSRLWFLSRGYDPIDPTLVFGRLFYIRVKGTDISILDAYGQKGSIGKQPSKKASLKAGNTNPYYYLIFQADSRTRHVPISLLVMATYNHQVPDRSKGEVIDHIDGNTLNNNPRNLRIVSRAINDRDAGFMRKLRNNGYNVAMFPGIILEGYARMAEWKETHTKRQYENLTREELLRVFVGPQFQVVDITPLDDLNINRHYDPFVERD